MNTKTENMIVLLAAVSGTQSKDNSGLVFDGQGRLQQCRKNGSVSTSPRVGLVVSSPHLEKVFNRER